MLGHALWLVFGIVASLIHRKSNLVNNFCISLLITLICNPYNIKNISVLLSYGGVAGIISFLRPVTELINKFIKQKNKFINYIKGIVSVSLSVQIIIVPIMIYYYKTVSFTFLISNILTRIFNQYYYFVWIYFSNYFFFINRNVKNNWSFL